MDVRYRHIKWQKLVQFFFFFFFEIETFIAIFGFSMKKSPTCVSDLNRRDNEYHWESLTIKVLFELISPLWVCWWQCWGGGLLAGVVLADFWCSWILLHIAICREVPRACMPVVGMGLVWLILWPHCEDTMPHNRSCLFVVTIIQSWQKSTQLIHVKIEIPSYSYSAGLRWLYCQSKKFRFLLKSGIL